MAIFRIFLLQDKFFGDFAAAFSKLLELGVPFPEPEKAP